MPPQGGPPMPPGPMPPGAPGMPPGPPGGAPQDPQAMKSLAQADLLSRIEQLGDHDLAAIQHGISPQAISVLGRIMPELADVLGLIEEGVHAAQGDPGDSGGDSASDDDAMPDDTDAQGVDPDEPDADDEEPQYARGGRTSAPRRSKTQLGRM